MTDFETTSLTLQAAAIATSTLIGLGQIAVVWYFGRQMVLANRDRNQDNRRLEQENQRRHAETMAALKNQAQASERQGQALAALVEGMQTQNHALQAVIDGRSA